MTNVILDRTGAPSSVWLLALMYVAFVLNHKWSNNIKNVPLTALLGVTVDISVLLCYFSGNKSTIKLLNLAFLLTPKNASDVSSASPNTSDMPSLGKFSMSKPTKSYIALFVLGYRCCRQPSYRTHWWGDRFSTPLHQIQNF